MIIRSLKMVLVVCSLSGLLGFSQQNPKQLNLQEAINYALEHNVNALNARRDIAISLKQKWETTASGLPQIHGDISYQNQLIQPTSFIPSEFFGGAPGTFTPVVFGVKQNASVNATLTQLLFDGSYLVGLQAAKTFLEFSKNANEKTILEIRKAVINAYGAVLISQESLAVFDNNIEVLTKNLHDTKIIVENGFAELETVEQLSITLAQLTNARENALQSKQIALQVFNNTIGLPIANNTVLTDTLQSLALVNGITANQNFEITKNIDFKIAKNFTKQRELELKLERSKALPSLSGFLTLGTATGRNEFDFLRDDTPWFAQSIVGVSLNVPIFSSGLRAARTAKAKLALEKANAEFDNTQQQLQLAYAKAKANHEFAVKTYKNTIENLELANRIAQKNNTKFKEGLATSFELRQAQLQLYTIQQEMLQSMLNIVLTKAEIDTLLNTPNFTNE